MNAPAALSVRAALAPLNAAMLAEPINYSRLIRAAKAGEVPASRQGKRWFINLSDLPTVAEHFLRRNAGRAIRRTMKGSK